MKNWEVASNHCCLLGEGPVWDAVNKTIYWIDILRGEIHQLFFTKNEHKIIKVGQTVGAIALKTNGGIIAALQNGFAKIDLERNSIEMLADPEADLPHNRFNDGKCDAAGRFWAGTMDAVNQTRCAGTLYVLDKNLSVKAKINKVTCSNGLAWSPDNTIFYFIDTPTRQVIGYDYEITTGAISNKKVVINIPVEEGYPDGMTVDTEGMLWIACWGGWKISRWNPFTGKLVSCFLLPVSQITSCIFGGETLEDLYITSAKTGLTEKGLRAQPLAGCLFVIRKSGFKGLPSFEFQG